MLFGLPVEFNSSQLCLLEAGESTRKTLTQVLEMSADHCNMWSHAKILHVGAAVAVRRIDPDHHDIHSAEQIQTNTQE